LIDAAQLNMTEIIPYLKEYANDTANSQIVSAVYTLAIMRVENL
jgi:hypothetical protein